MQHSNLKSARAALAAHIPTMPKPSARDRDRLTAFKLELARNGLTDIPDAPRYEPYREILKALSYHQAFQLEKARLLQAIADIQQQLATQGNLE
jgi:hypothetical protein